MIVKFLCLALFLLANSGAAIALDRSSISGIRELGFTNRLTDDDDDDDGDSRNLRVFGLTDDQRLIRFNSNNPRSSRTVGSITGLIGDTVLVGIDFRVQDGLLYGVGNAGGIYTIDTSNGVATKVRQLTIALAGSSFGVDFNPAANALRVISDTGQNLRQPFATNPAATVMDTNLNYTGAPATGVTGAAYTNNDLNADTATTLFDIDSNLDQVVIQSPANSGQLAAAGKLTVDTNSAVGFDIYSSLRAGVTVGNTAFASLTVNGEARFYAIDLLTGKATSRGAFRDQDQVTDIAIPLNQ